MRFLLYSNIFVALCAASLVTASRALLGATPEPGFLELHVFFATLAVYNVDRLVEGAEDTVAASERHRWIAAHRNLLRVVTALGSVGTLLTLSALRREVVFGLLPLAVVSFLYSVPLFGSERRLKSLTGAKTFVIALVWSIVTVVLPAIEIDSGFPSWLLGERFLFIFAITLPFELRDLRRDEVAGIRSIAHLLGPLGTVATSVAFLFAFALSSLAHYESGRVVAALVLSALVAAALTFRARTPQRDVFYSLSVDGTMLLQASLVLLAI